MARLFISQERLDAWSQEEKVRVEGDTMLLGGDGRSFRLVPAVRFLATADEGGEDPHGLVGRVKSEQQLAEMGADRMLDSILFDDVAYRVQPGFLGVPHDKAPE